MDQKYRGYLLRGSNVKGTPKVAVLSGAARLHIADGETMDEAFDSARSWVDTSKSEDVKERPPGGHAASVKEYIRYFKANPPRGFEVAMLRANAQRPLTAGQLAQAAGWDSYESANAHYGSLGANVGRTLGLEFIRRKDGSEFFMSSLVKELEEKDSQSGFIRFEMHPELVEALKQLGIA